jgi:hypothetical protein
MHDMQKSGGFVLGDTPFRQIYFVEIIKPNGQGLLLGVILIVTHLGAANRAVAIIKRAGFWGFGHGFAPPVLSET